MRPNKYYYRGKMLRLFLDKDFAITTKSRIFRLFKDIKEEEKEDIAKKIISLIETSKTEEEFVARAKEIKGDTFQC